MDIPTCPYLGLHDDPETQVAFPSLTNFCHHLKTPRSVSLEYQSTFCQSERHMQCEVFPEGYYIRLPAGAQVVVEERFNTRRPWLWIAVIVLLLFTVGGVTLAQPSLRVRLDSGKTLPAPPVTAPPLATQPASTATPLDLTATATLSGTVGLNATLSTVAPAPLGLETPLGVNPALLIHRVLPGESLDLIAAHFDTSVESIQDINYFLPSPLMADLPIIIPLGQTQTAGLPKFEAYQVSVPGITLAQFAQSLGIDAAQLRTYNLLPEEAVLVDGQWLLLPRPAE